MPGGHSHRSGSLKQSNKKNKRSKASKRSINRLNGGRVEGRGAGFKQRLVAHNKNDRRHILAQKREAKRLALIQKRRGVDGGPAPPRVVGVISLGESDLIEEKVRSLIIDQADKVTKTFGDDNLSTVSAKFEIHKKDGNLTVLTNSTAFLPHYSTENDEDGAVMAALDLCRVCDVVLFVLDGNAPKPSDNVIGISVGGDDHSTKTGATTVQDFDHLISAKGDRILAAAKGQGLPRILTVLAKTEAENQGDDDYMTTQSAKSLRRSNLKRRTELKKYVSRFATTEFGVDNEKVVEVDVTDYNAPEDQMLEERKETSADAQDHVKKTLAAAFVRTLCTVSGSPAKWVSEVPRPYVLSDRHEYDASTQSLAITGYVRGLVPFDINSLVHIPNLGTFACKEIRKAQPPNSRVRDASMTDDPDIVKPDPMRRDPLEMFATPDSLEGEQNLIGFDEADEHFDEDGDEDNEGFARPAGWSDYQSAWLDAVDDNESVDAADFDHGELAKELNQKKTTTVSLAPDDAMDLEDANQISHEERQALLEERRKEEQEHTEFPDEVQVDEDEKARDRFARYRSLKSFRKSHWDPKENLPESYGSIFHFRSFKTTQRSVMSEMKELARVAAQSPGFWGKSLDKEKSGDVSMGDSDDDDDDILEGCVPSGSYVTLIMENVSPSIYKGISPTAPLAAVALLPHENKVSVMHMALSQNSGCEVANSEVPVKSKDVLTFRCGWRTWQGRPIFSQHNLNCDKHKFERFLPPSFFCASVFGPVTYTPCPVLVFRTHEGRQELVAIGNMLAADADRIVLKRIVLTGYPVRVHKRVATVKYMFYNPEDVKWFQPAGLTTKHGLQGNIEQSVGEHGTMKCLFNAPIKQHDTVCLPLYKRIFPKFAGVNVAGDDGGTVRSIAKRNILVVR
jgi:pre-rRNA-processing protein TSR1